MKYFSTSKEKPGKKKVEVGKKHMRHKKLKKKGKPGKRVPTDGP